MFKVAMNDLRPIVSQAWLQTLAKIVCFLMIGLLAGCSENIPDASTVNVQQMIVNLAKTMPSLLKMLSAFSYILGFALVFKGIYKLKEYGEMRTAMSSQTNLWSAIITLVVGSMLVFFVSSYQMGIQTLFHYDSPLAYSGGSSSTDDLVSSIVLIVQIVGVIAFIRGLLLLNSAGGHSAQPGTIGKGATFVVGGVLSINLYGTWQMLVNTLIGQ